MIFVTVGTQLAFDRLINTIDQWAAGHPDVEIFAQTGPAKFKPSHISAVEFVAPTESTRLFCRSSLIVSHAGMGSVLTALRFRKPILIFPRRAELGEHRNDHQVATAKWLEGRAGISVCWDEDHLLALLERRGTLAAGVGISEFADENFIGRIRGAIFNE